MFYATANVTNIAMETIFFLRRHTDAPPSDKQTCNLIQCVTDQNKGGIWLHNRNNEGDEGKKGKKTRTKQ
jgi:hypothetical protein